VRSPRPRSSSSQARSWASRAGVKEIKGPGMGGGRGLGAGRAFWLAPKHLLGGLLRHCLERVT
jgi:hypothetical protein